LLVAPDAHSTLPYLNSLCIEERDAEILAALGIFALAVSLVWSAVRMSTAKAPPRLSGEADVAGTLKMESLKEAEWPSAEQLGGLIAGRRSIFPKDFTGDSVDRAVIEVRERR